jgi:hypothetical protein
MVRLASVLAAAVTVAGGCGDNRKAADARGGPDRRSPPPGRGRIGEPAFPNPTSYDTDSTFEKRVAITVSTDVGRSFGSVGIDPQLGSNSPSPSSRVHVIAIRPH